MADASVAAVRDFERLINEPATVQDMAKALQLPPGTELGDGYFGQLLQALPTAVYATDAEGRIVFYNEAAAALWGYRPTLGESAFCGSWKLYWPDGTPLPHDECPMALALKTKQAVRGMEAVAERPDGTRVPFVPHPTPLFDAAGILVGAVNMLVDISDQQQIEQRLRESETRYRSIVDNVSVAFWEEDFSAVVEMLVGLRAQGVNDLHDYFQAHPDQLAEAIRRVRVVDANDFTIELFEADGKQTLLRSLSDVFLPETELIFIDELVALWEGRRRFTGETVLRTLKGKRLDVMFTMVFEGERAERTLVSILDISARKAAERAVLAQTYRLEKLNRVARAISSDLQLDHIVQTVTDAATELSGARFGAFFYNVIDAQGGHYQLYALSGAPRAAFERFGMPRATAIFAPTFRGTGIVRSADIRRDPRYGKNVPHHGMPVGHLPVVSYLAVPVISRSGEVHGGLFFGHDHPGVFTRDSEDIVAAIAAHAAIALDNARLLQSAQAEATFRRRADEASQRLAAIVESTDDAIISKNLDGIITSWNRSAQRLFGYTPGEAIGQSIMLLIPPDRHDEELTILSRIRRGEHLDHYETIRRRKDGSLVEVSLTVSPVRDADGRIAGASKIARDITDRRRAEEQQELLVREMSHRIKNLFAVTNSVVALSARSARTPQDMATAVQGRLSALTRAHDLVRPSQAQQRFGQHASLQAIIRTTLSPYVEAARSTLHDRIDISGTDVPVGSTAITSLALILHEFATNAAKYGALSLSTGSVTVDCTVVGDDMLMTWQERGGPPLAGPPESEGFGGQLARRMVAGQFDGEATWDWQPEGVVIRLSIPLARLAT
ncbi:PAS domain S-box protein [Reyranella sp. CPCC 100927]|uniref:sensor histidine kinase n=1 Tax=Reyranella sp. CPCC 100927 TaxID=2599616 RepID=UPI002106F1A6|nr:PAS domain S-box protein [Reyranella sp. CPCC 100927]